GRWGHCNLFLPGAVSSTVFVIACAYLLTLSMKHFLLTGLLGFVLLISAQAQTLSKINFDAVKKSISSSKSKLYYPNLLKRYHANDPKLTLDEYKHLYYGWTFQAGYNPYRPNDKSDAL